MKAAVVGNRWVVELDSTTERKFSRHLVVALPGATFASNAQVGAFVRELCVLADSRRLDDPAAAQLFVKKVRGCSWFRASTFYRNPCAVTGVLFLQMVRCGITAQNWDVS